MAVGLNPPAELLAIDGLRLGTARAGIRKPDRRDLVVLELAEGAETAAVFTRNRFCAAPVHLAREHLAGSAPRYLLINTGNANAGTGQRGARDALRCCQALADQTGVAVNRVLPFSTGVIGEPLPVERLTAGLPAALAALQADGWQEAAEGILTTDTLAKGCSRQIELDGHTITLTGIAKGAGMIRPDMATMLAFIATDCSIGRPLLRRLLRDAADQSFNRITVDGDTSTNDACVLVATGASHCRLDALHPEDVAAFAEALADLCRELAQAIVRDGEGATRFITISVDEASSAAEALDVAYCIAHSPLVKTAFFAGDPNWGRILAAVGRAGVEELDVEGVRISLDDLCLAENGGRAEGYTEEAAAERMRRQDIGIRVALGRGGASETVWTCDFSYEYVRINAEYRT
ncbi:bifunctional glutamate N-acetyltransferase/amino-acid acetyltransferase ArgJ [Methylonatrum kenyense]|uniref:bifunctional glutamate N-acetyltransferase/amino-acid acetyltransferase ArgJ n=1 Tax=Methylonatrum kenyense TaxID=455253 RepID=UPI0020BD590E|nr:bifunctional glutamate N-acetyltransferase/amino-acid acetyltransferase ArgJ [Methylonatrum kenyense]MCK8516301.1 bifunctional glutamate N-acetyltransferase/amino-acid acetyltransferase ArgJ [Methylonatrum kenyense]